MKQAKPLTIRQMSLAELDMVLDWAAAEGWNPGLHDAACFYAADPAGFLLGLVDGEAVASIFAVKYGAGFAFIGGYIVKPAWRGMGYGKALWDAAMVQLAGRNVGLDGVVAQQANYAKSGFALAYRNIRFAGAGSGQPVDMAHIVPLSSVDFETLRQYDAPLFPDERADFLRCWVQQAGSVAVGAMVGGRLAGYAVMRRCRQGYKIGPLCADTAELADALFVSLKGRAATGVPVFLDVPEVNLAACGLAQRHGLQSCFETARMYTGAQPAMQLQRQFGVTSFELG
ncbi:MAG: GNAT family N-acetyltransferase [Pseudomonadota bacterium]